MIYQAGAGTIQSQSVMVEGTVTSFKSVEQRLDHMDRSLNEKLDKVNLTVAQIEKGIEQIQKTNEESQKKLQKTIEETHSLIKDANTPRWAQRPPSLWSIKGMDWWAENGPTPCQLNIAIWIVLGTGFVFLLGSLKNLFC